MKRATGFHAYETVGGANVNLRVVKNLNLASTQSAMLELTFDCWKILVRCCGSEATFFMTFADKTAALLRLQSADPLRPYQITEAPIWQFARVRGDWIVDSVISSGIVESKLIPRKRGWLWHMACAEVGDAVDPRSGKVLPSERSLLSGPSKVPDRDWPEWDEFSRQVDSMLDVMHIHES